MASPDAPVFSIQHFCLHDGPGIRSVVFFKGCPLRCDWCQNPESWSREPELGFKERLCISCGRCADACPADAEERPVWRRDRGVRTPGVDSGVRALNGDNGVRASSADSGVRALCRRCFACADACPSGALVRLGELHPANDILREIAPEVPLFHESGGGVTFSGGEPALYPEFCAGLAKRLHSRKIHVAMETSGMFNAGAAKGLLGAIDLVLFDIKLFSDKEHRAHCGTGNDIIKKNLKLLAGAGRGRPKLRPRLPLVPGVTGTKANLSSWAGFLKKLGIGALTLVPYHRMGNDKRLWLGLAPAPEYAVPAQEEIVVAREIFRRQGIRACLPGEEEWS